MKTLIGGVYVRNGKFIKIRHTDSRQSLKTTQRDIGSSENNTHMGRPKRVTRKPQRLIESMNLSGQGTPKEDLYNVQKTISSLSLFIHSFLILGRVAVKAFCQRERGDVMR